MPLQDIARIKQSGVKTEVTNGPELRIDLPRHRPCRAPSCKYSNVKGKNPFKDKRVRQAFYQAIDIEAIKRQGDARPRGARPA